MTVRALETIAANYLPLTKPDAPRLSDHVSELQEIERSCWLSNYGPTNTRLEAAMIENWSAPIEVVRPLTRLMEPRRTDPMSRKRHKPEEIIAKLRPGWMC